MQNADPEKVSSTAKSRGLTQIGTLGSGNHFLEIQKVDKIFNPETAKAFGIREEGQITVMIHCGSRGYGHQVCSDYLRVMEHAVQKYKISFPIENSRVHRAIVLKPETIFSNGLRRELCVLQSTRDNALGTAEFPASIS